MGRSLHGHRGLLMVVDQVDYRWPYSSPRYIERPSARSGSSNLGQEMGSPEEDLLTEKSRLAWLTWKASLRDPEGHSNWDRAWTRPSRRPWRGSRRCFRRRRCQRRFRSDRSIRLINPLSTRELASAYGASRAASSKGSAWKVRILLTVSIGAERLRRSVGARLPLSPAALRGSGSVAPVLGLPAPAPGSARSVR
jgi:hypothetical protein